MGDSWPWAPPTYVTWNDVFTEMNSLGQTAQDCATYAAIAEAESSLDLTVLNDTPSTGDYSVGAFQVNYYGSLYASRAAQFGTPQQLATGGLTKQCLAAVAIGAGGFTPWSTYNSGAYLNYMHGYGPTGSGGGTSAPPTIQEGSTGPYVVQLQTDLDQLGYSLAKDGDFGPLTRAAVVSFQAQQGIAQDGIVGPITWQHLANAMAAAQGGGSPGPTSIPPPPSEPPGNIDPDTLNAWSSFASSAEQGYVTNAQRGQSASATFQGV